MDTNYKMPPMPPMKCFVEGCNKPTQGLACDAPEHKKKAAEAIAACEAGIPTFSHPSS